MRATPAVTVMLRPATAEDCRQVWLWRNDEDTRRASLDPSFIPLPTHERWFVESLQSRNRRIYIVVAGDQPSGVVRLDIAARQGMVSIHLAPERRGLGIGPMALRALSSLSWGELALDGLLALVKPDNYASISAFRKAGFRVAPRTDPTVPTVTLTKVRQGDER